MFRCMLCKLKNYVLPSLFCCCHDQIAEIYNNMKYINRLALDFTAPTLSTPYETIGCFQDAVNRAIPTLEGLDPILDGNYWNRQNAIKKCYKAAKKRNFHVFAVQHGGWCASSFFAADTFDRYGNSSACGAEGKGGELANQVYVIKGN